MRFIQKLSEILLEKSGGLSVQQYIEYCRNRFEKWLKAANMSGDKRENTIKALDNIMKSGNISSAIGINDSKTIQAVIIGAMSSIYRNGMLELCILLYDDDDGRAKFKKLNAITNGWAQYFLNKNVEYGGESLINKLIFVNNSIDYDILMKLCGIAEHSQPLSSMVGGLSELNIEINGQKHLDKRAVVGELYRRGILNRKEVARASYEWYSKHGERGKRVTSILGRPQGNEEVREKYIVRRIGQGKGNKPNYVLLRRFKDNKSAKKFFKTWMSENN